MSEIRMTFDYEEPRPHVWHALTDPACMTRWMVAARPEGFEPRAGCHFRFIGKPRPGWSGIVDCEVVVETAPSRLRFNWISDGDPTMDLTFDLEELGAGTRLHFAQTGFRGVSGFVMELVMRRVRRKMFAERLPAVLATLGAGP